MLNHWISKFAHAGRGIAETFRGQASFKVHLSFALLAGALAVWLRPGPAESALVLFAIALVVCLEMVNTALESLAKAITSDTNEYVRSALDISAGAVLVASLFAIAIGGLVFLPRIWSIIGIGNAVCTN